MIYLNDLQTQRISLISKTIDYNMAYEYPQKNLKRVNVMVKLRVTYLFLIHMKHIIYSFAI